jgi:hypothetical protein
MMTRFHLMSLQPGVAADYCWEIHLSVGIAHASVPTTDSRNRTSLVFALIKRVVQINWELMRPLFIRLCV